MSGSTETSSERWVLAVTALASLMAALDLLVVSTALTTIQADLGASVDQLQWTITAYSLCLAGLLMAGGALGDRFGRRRVFTIGLAVFTAASGACALAPSVGWLVAGRAVQGVGAAVVLPLAVALLSATFPADRRGRALGIVEGVTGLATIAGPLVGGAVAEAVGWEWIFWLNVPIGLVTLLMTRARVEESHGSATTVDVPGLALITGAALGLVWGLVRGNDLGWREPQIAAALAVGVLLLAAFAAWERRAVEPLLPPRFLRSPGFSAGGATGFFLFAALYASVFLLSQVLQIGLGHSPGAAGLRLVPWTATLLLVAPAAGALADRFGDRPLLMLGLTLDAIGLGWIALIAGPEVTYTALVAPLVVAGVGGSMAIPVVHNAVVGAVARNEAGKASGASNMVQELGGVFGVAVAVTAFATAGSYESAAEFLAGFAPGMGVASGLALAGLAASTGVPRRARATVGDARAAG